MALEKTILVPSLGLKLQYWKIARISVDADIGIVEVVVYGWPSKTHRQRGNPPLHRMQFVLYGEQAEKLLRLSDIVEHTYDILKEQPVKVEDMVIVDFTGSKDV